MADTNAVASLLINSDLTSRAEVLRAKDRDWRVPSLFVHEWLNVVTLNLRAGRLDRDEAVRVFRRGMAMVTVMDGTPDALRIFNLHMSSGCSSYDCQFVDLAQELRVTLFTSDKQVLRSFPSVATPLSTV